MLAPKKLFEKELLKKDSAPSTATVLHRQPRRPFFVVVSGPIPSAVMNAGLFLCCRNILMLLWLAASYVVISGPSQTVSVSPFVSLSTLQTSEKLLLLTPSKMARDVPFLSPILFSDPSFAGPD